MAKAKSSGGNFIQKILASILGSDDPEYEKKRRLKAIAKRLSKSHYHFYKSNSGEMLPPFPKLLYEIYKAVSPAQVFFQNIKNPNAVKTAVIEYFLSDTQRKIEEELTQKAIAEKSKTMPLPQFTAYVQQRLEAFIDGFTDERTATIEQRYKELMYFKDFCSYDYYFTLKKFNASLIERDFSVPPQFEKIDGKYIADDIKDFTTLMWNITGNIDWAPMIKMLKDIRGVEPVPIGVWKKIVTKMQHIQATGVFDMIVRLITQDPDYTPLLNDVSANIVEPFINKFKLETTAALKKLESAATNSKVNELLVKLFNTASVSYLKNYIAENSSTLEKKKLAGYLYCDALNYVKGFLIEFVKKDIREYCDLVLVRGAWVSTPVSMPMSNAYNDLLSASEAISAFDDDLADDGKVGMKIKTLLPRTQHASDAAAIINRLVGESNAQAKAYIVKATRDLVTIGKMIRWLIEDEKKKSPEVITNWKEIERVSDKPPYEIGAAVYQKIYVFALLMQTCMGGAAQ